MSAEDARVETEKHLNWHQMVLDSSGPNKRKKSQYRLKKRVGSGTYGVCYEAEDTLNEGRIVAIKCTKNPDDDCHYISLEMKRELMTLDVLNDPGHENVLKSIAHFGNEEFYVTFIVMPYYPYGDLHDFLPILSGMKREHRVKIIEVFTGQLADAMEFMHRKGVCHRDFKSANILVDKLVGEEKCRLVVGDFGLSRTQEQDEDGKCYSSEGVFTIPYRSTDFLLDPEKHNAYSCDVWGLGVVVAEMIDRKYVFGKEHTDEDVLQAQFKMLGTPTEEYWPGVTKAKNWRHDFPVHPLVPVEELPKWTVRKITPPILAVLAKAMVMNPAKRGSAADLVQAFKGALDA
jgi:cyclin-dependent kinase